MAANYLDFEKKSIDSIKSWQWKKVRDALERAKYTKFYRKFFEKNRINVDLIRSWADFEKIPFTTADDFRNYSKDFLFGEIEEVWKIFATSGTTGKPKIIYREPITKKSEILSVWHHLFKRLDYWPKAVGVARPAGGVAASGPVTEKVMELLGIPTFSFAPEADFDKIIDTITAVKFDALVVSPSFGALLAAKMKEKGFLARNLGIKVIIATGEPLNLNERVYLTKEYNAEVVNTYGAADPSVWLASECHFHRGLHIFPYTSYLELIDKDGNLSQEEGELVVTPFSNRAMPLIRYRIGDICKIDFKNLCKCGRTLGRIMFVGRAEEPIKIRIGARLIPLSINRIMVDLAREVPEIMSFYNFIYRRRQKIIDIIFEVDKTVISKKKFEQAIKREVISKFKEKLSKVIGHAKNRQVDIQLRCRFVKLGSLKRQAAKIKDRVRVE